MREGSESDWNAAGRRAGKHGTWDGGRHPGNLCPVRGLGWRVPNLDF